MSEDSRRVDAAKSAEERPKKEQAAGASRGSQKKEEQLALKDAKSSSSKSAKSSASTKVAPNNVRKFRMERMMSKAELARRAGISTLTVDRVERGMNCRMDTKRKILEALELKPSDRKTVFPEDD